LCAVANRGFNFRLGPIKLAEKDSPVLSPQTSKIWQEDSGTVGELARYMIEHHPLGWTSDLTL
ncbi:MAG: hypothetical protein OXG71_04095, partial [Rhodospirillales bacterium]|nr:hypothetical protein [Rhodospirillales bacterium]